LHAVLPQAPRPDETELVIEAVPTQRRRPPPLHAPLAEPTIDNPHSRLPIVYQPADRAVLEPFIIPATAEAQT